MEFKTIDINKTKETCLKLRSIAELSSFGVSTIGNEAQKYYDWLENLIERNPSLCAHVYKDNAIIAQIEAQVLDATKGYVNLYSIFPQYRSLGIGSIMDEYICQKFSDLGIKNIEARVSKSNERAVAFYLKNGWLIEGDCPEDTKLLKISKPRV